MATFTYTATSNKNGKVTTGEVEASSRDEAVKVLLKQEMTPVTVKAASKGFNFASLTGGSKVKTDELVIFTRQLSTMINAGVPLIRALNSLEEHASTPAFKTIISGVKADIESGAALADALEKHSETFSDIYVNMVRAGEAAGILDDVLNRLALQQEKAATIRKKIKSAMTYPMVLVGISTIAFFGLMIFVIPRIGKILSDLGGPDAKLPALTQFMLGLSGFMTSFWYIVFPALFGGIFMLRRYIKTPAGKKQFHRLILKAPAVSPIIKKVAVARFARTYASLIGAGVSVIDALSITAKAVGNVRYEEVILEASDAVQNGEQLSKVIEKHEDLFPSILAQMLAVGEETGQTDTVLVKVANFYEEEVDVAIEGISSIIEPVMIVFMGGMVGIIAVSVMQPIATLSQNIK